MRTTRSNLSVGAIILGLGALLMCAALPARAWELGVINTWIRGQRPQGGTATAHGGSLMLRQDIWRYADVSLRAGYVRSDCFKVYYVPLEGTASFKYPLCDDRLVPFLGLGLGYHFFTSGTIALRNSPSIFPMLGLDWRFSTKKKWSLYIEGRWEFINAKVDSGSVQGSTAKFTGPGGSWGVSYRF